MNRQELSIFIEENINTTSEKLLEIAGNEITNQYMDKLAGSGASFRLGEDDPEKTKAHNLYVIKDWLCKNLDKTRDVICKDSELKKIFKNDASKTMLCINTAVILHGIYPDLTVAACGAIAIYLLNEGYQGLCANYLN